jgi:hypothetical protein
MTTEGSNGSGTALTIRRGANLPADEWADERISAAVKFLPARFRQPENAITFLALAHRYGLDPFAREIFPMSQREKIKDPETGEVQYVERFQVMVSAAGLAKKVRHDRNLAGMTSQVVYKGDTFGARRLPNGKIEVTHETDPFSAGEWIGGYTLIKGAGDRPDVLVTRRKTDYAQLLNRKTWIDYGQDMILNRTGSVAARIATDLGGVYTEADFEMPEDAPAPAASARTADTLAAMREAITDTPIEADYVIEEPDGSITTPPGQVAGEEPDTVGIAWDTKDDWPHGFYLARTGAGWYMPNRGDPDHPARGTPISDKKLRLSDALDALHNAAYPPIEYADADAAIQADTGEPERILAEAEGHDTERS